MSYTKAKRPQFSIERGKSSAQVRFEKPAEGEWNVVGSLVGAGLRRYLPDGGRGGRFTTSHDFNASFSPQEQSSIALDVFLSARLLESLDRQLIEAIDAQDWAETREVAWKILAELAGSYRLVTGRVLQGAEAVKELLEDTKHGERHFLLGKEGESFSNRRSSLSNAARFSGLAAIVEICEGSLWIRTDISDARLKKVVRETAKAADVDKKTLLSHYRLLTENPGAVENPHELEGFQTVVDILGKEFNKPTWAQHSEMLRHLRNTERATISRRK